jgi:hypothetical protein
MARNWGGNWTLGGWTITTACLNTDAGFVNPISDKGVKY